MWHRIIDINNSNKYMYTRLTHLSSALTIMFLSEGCERKRVFLEVKFLYFMVNAIDSTSGIFPCQVQNCPVETIVHYNPINKKRRKKFKSFQHTKSFRESFRKMFHLSSSS